MPFMRRRPLLRAAAVGGGAYALGKHSANKQAEQQDQAYQAGAADAAPAPAAPASSGITSQDTERLAELGRLHDSGVLTDEEFAQQKSRILGV
ncbi:MAG TPA: SHOCT domain-containing protein [Solirubrobacteraceae bacterium]